MANFSSLIYEFFHIYHEIINKLNYFSANEINHFNYILTMLELIINQIKKCDIYFYDRNNFFSSHLRVVK